MLSNKWTAYRIGGRKLHSDWPTFFMCGDVELRSITRFRSITERWQKMSEIRPNGTKTNVVANIEGAWPRA